jgi:short-subunit dehydrogenase
MRIIVLGGSSGIGKQFVIELANENEVVAISNNITDLLKLQNQLNDKGININIEEANLINIEELEAICMKYLDFDLVINSAGIGRLGDITTTDSKIEMDNINLNVNSFYYITKIFANEMVKRKSGSIINICSSASFTPMPNFSLYAATKAFAGSYTIAVSKECRKNGVYIMALCPGPTITNFLTQEQFQKLKDLYKINGIIMTPEQVVKKALKAFKKKKVIYIPGFINKFIYYFDKFMPVSFVINIIYKTYEKIITEVSIK